VNGTQTVEVVRTKVPRPAVATVVLGRGQAIVEVGQRGPSELTSLLDPALKQRPLYQLDSFRGLVAVVTWKNDRRYAGPNPRRCEVPKGHGVWRHTIQNRTLAAAFRLELLAIELVRLPKFDAAVPETRAELRWSFRARL